MYCLISVFKSPEDSVSFACEKLGAKNNARNKKKATFVFFCQ